MPMMPPGQQPMSPMGGLPPQLMQLALAGGGGGAGPQGPPMGGPPPGGPGGMPGAGGPPPMPGGAGGGLSGPGGPGGGTDSASKLAELAMQMIQDPKVAQGMAFKGVFDTVPKLWKSQSSVQTMAPKMTATTPFQPPVGRADQMALQQMQQRQQGGPPMPQGQPSAPGGQMPPPELLQQLAMQGGR